MKVETGELSAQGMPLRVTLHFDMAGEAEQASVLVEALKVYSDRAAKYGSNWRRKGWRGALFGARLAIERAWDMLWSAAPGRTISRGHPPHDVDDLIDAINYAAMAVRLVEVGARDGEWSYPEELPARRCFSTFNPGPHQPVVQCELPEGHHNQHQARIGRPEELIWH